MGTGCLRFVRWVARIRRQTRFRLLDTIREYAAERLEADGETGNAGSGEGVGERVAEARPTVEQSLGVHDQASVGGPARVEREPVQLGGGDHGGDDD